MMRIQTSLIRVFSALAIGVLFSACTEVIETPPPPIAAAPRIVEFTATPSVVSTGEAVEVKWSVENATSVSIREGSLGEISGVDNKLTGALTLNPTEPLLLVLTARNERGVIDTAAVAVELIDGAQEVNFFASARTVNAGEPVVLGWSAPGARSVQITANGTALDLGGQLGAGSIAVRPTEDTTYVFTADATTREASVAIRPQLLDFAVTPTAVEPNATVRVSWRTSNAPSVQIEEGFSGESVTITDPGQVREGTHTDTIPGTVDPSSAFSYRITVTTASGLVLRDLRTLYLSGHPRFEEVNAPHYARKGETFPISWVTAEATRVEILVDGVTFYQSPSVARAANGSVNMPSPNEPTTYTLVAYGARGGEVRETVTVDPVGAPVVNHFTATPATAVAGQPVQLSYSVDSARGLRIYAVDGMHVQVINGLATQDTLTVYPNSDTKYVLEIDNGIGDKLTDEEDVTVTGEPLAITTTDSIPLLEGTDFALTFPGADQGQLIYGYPHGIVDSRPASPNFIDISQTGQLLTFLDTSGDPEDDEGLATFNLPENFETFLWGSRYQGLVTVSTNGWLTFGEWDSAELSNVTFPTSTGYPPSMVAPFWDDLELDGGEVRWEVRGQAPDQFLIVQWTDITPYNRAAASLTFQAQIFQTGVVRIVYGTMDFAGSWSATVGTQDAIRSSGRNFNDDNVASNLEVTFFGPKSSATGVANEGGPFYGFVDRGDGYVRMSFTMPAILPDDALKLSEVNPLPHANAPGSEYFEVFNNSDLDVDLHGWTIQAGTQSHLIDRANGNTILKAQDVLVLGKSRDPALNDGLGDIIQYAYGDDIDLPIKLKDTGVGLYLMKNGKDAMHIDYDDYDLTPGTGGVGVSRNIDTNLYRRQDETGSWLRWCAANTPYGTQTPQQMGSPGRPVSCFGYVFTKGASSFFDIRTQGGIPLLAPTATQMNEVFVMDLPGGHAFPFFGQDYTRVLVSGSGYLQFTIPSTIPSKGWEMGSASYPDTASEAREAYVTPNGSIIAFGDALYRRADKPESNVYYLYVPEGLDPANPDAHWIFQWNHATNLSSGTDDDDINFQVKLFKDGVIEIHFDELVSGTSSNYALGSSAMTWIENPQGNYALVANHKTAGLVPHSMFRFIPW